MVTTRTPHPDWKWFYVTRFKLAGLTDYYTHKDSILYENHDLFLSLIDYQALYYPVLVIRIRYPTEELFMADQRANWTFIHYKIPREDESKLKDYIKSCKDSVDTPITVFASQGYKISISWVDDKNSYVVTVSPKEGSKVNSKSSLPSWSDDWQEAIFMCGYKHEVLCDGGDWTPLLDKDDNWG